MLTNVYIWKPTFYCNKGSSVGPANVPLLHGFGLNLSWGHAAVEMVDPERAQPPFYASYWPPQKVPSKCVYSYEEDTDVMERQASTVITIEDLDYQAMDAAWQRELAKDFHNFRHNCCTVATQLLDAGFKASMCRGVGSFIKKAGRSLWVGMRRPITTIQAQLAAAQGLAVFDPDAVEKFALILKHINA